LSSPRLSSTVKATSKGRQQLLETLIFQLSRELSTRTVLFHAAIAERMGLSQGDHKALDLINDAANSNAPITAGQLAEATGLTSGAITGVVDRLEKANLARRAPDALDRRKVVLQPTHARDDEFWQLLAPIAEATASGLQDYSDAELELIARFIRHSIEITKRETNRLRETIPDA
jgi:DNA-binding MarR family transcriptional regulator